MGGPIFQRISSPESLLPKDPRTRKLQNLHWQLLVLKFTGKSLQCLENRQVCTCVLVPAWSHCSWWGSTAGSRWSQELPLKPGKSCAESRRADCASCVKSAVRWARSKDNKIKCHQCKNEVSCLVFLVPSLLAQRTPAYLRGCPACSGAVQLSSRLLLRTPQRCTWSKCSLPSHSVQ